ncbi:patatin-like phospholipase family protein [Xanthovirga aplysinae]|uniref:patatin-like phospholipase family protein n=1 Tax=Xanthovirga aplysinae TaxID=2529853 RepID=UPI0012BD532D|nr:patatin-like phospholipase family protein [Xanthovirga aplysinae]MTI32033.1 patatin-like phospholipase family protein [Xanthovirga aplysinae]
MLKSLLYSFPIQLLINHFKKNYLILLCWGVLFAFVTGNLGKTLGIPYLFLDPEYMHKTNFWGFLIMGLTLGGFSMAFNITCYIVDSHRFSFIGTLTHPFPKFCLNNAIIPLAFIGIYVYKVIDFQIDFEYMTPLKLLDKIAGLFIGFGIVLAGFFIYFRFTNTDIFLYIADNLNKQLKKLPFSRRHAMRQLHRAKKKNYPVENYLDLRLRVRKNNERQNYYDKETILKVFNQNHLNSIIIELLLFILIFSLGAFSDHPIFQIPAAASAILFMTFVLIFTGALIYWFRSWSLLIVLVFLFIGELLVRQGFLGDIYKAYGLNYNIPPVEYSLKQLKKTNGSENYTHDYEQSLHILENWRKKFPPTENPKLVFICVSGGGQRSALWSLRALQVADSISGGKLFEHTLLITGASGGLIGASYFRELKFRQQQKEDINPYHHKYLDKIASDNLNPVIFNMLTNDLFMRFKNFTYAQQIYPKDRGFAFEEQLNRNTDFLMDKKLSDYQLPEQKAQIPMLIISPTITNDGRKLFISPQHVSYMGTSPFHQNIIGEKEYKGVDFRRYLEKHGADSLRFISALRMSATFPYFTPTITLPTNPPIEIMDAGIADNFGISVAVHFMQVFKDWINENTSGVVIVSIRDSEKNKPIKHRNNNSLFYKFFTPIESLYRNWENIQDLNNDHTIELAHQWFEKDLDKIELQYIYRLPHHNGGEESSFKPAPTNYKQKNNEASFWSPINDNFSNKPPSRTTSPKQLEKVYENSNSKLNQSFSEEKENHRAALSWHLTSREKKNIRENIFTKNNQKAIKDLLQLLDSSQEPVQVSSQNKREEP